MADEENQEAPDGAEASPDSGAAAGKGSRGPLKLLGGVVGLIATGLALAVLAMPSKEGPRTFQGPAMHTFFGEGELVGNPLDDNFSRYLKFKPSCSYFAYDLEYPKRRREDPHYETLMREKMQHTVSRLTIDEVMSGTNRDVFATELEKVAEPVLFPVHVGETVSPFDEDPESGLRIGESQDRRGTFRGYFHENVLKVDAVQKTIQLDGGPVARFQGGEYDLLVESESGETLYLDVTHLRDDFVGEVEVGVQGRIRRLFTGDIIAQ